MVKQSRGTLPKEAVEHLKNWLFLHFQHPYPSEDEKAALAEETSLTLVQVNNWFINARRRLWKPIIEKQTQKDSISAADLVQEMEVKEETLERASLSLSIISEKPEKQSKQAKSTRKDSPLNTSTILIQEQKEEPSENTFNSPLMTLAEQVIPVQTLPLANSKPIDMIDIIELYSTNTLNLKEKIERAEKELNQVLNQSKLFSQEHRKKKLFERWNHRDSNPLSLERMKTVESQSNNSLPIGMDYFKCILSD